MRTVRTVEVWSDVVCPWCWIGEARLKAALAERPEVAVRRVWRPFQLQPGMPKGVAWADFAPRKFGGEAAMAAAFSQVTRAGAAEGLTFRFDRVATAPNTADAHRLILRAQESDPDAVWRLVDALFAAYFAEGADLNDAATLAAVAERSVGVPSADTLAFLVTDALRDAVDAGQEEAARLGASGVPFYVFDRRYAVPGAVPAGTFGEVLDALAAEDGAEGAAR